MSAYSNRHKTPYVYNSKLVMDGTVQRVKQLKADGKHLNRLEKSSEEQDSKHRKFTTRV